MRQKSTPSKSRAAGATRAMCLAGICKERSCNADDSCFCLPTCQDFLYLAPHLLTREHPVAETHEQFVVTRVLVADVRDDRRAQSLQVKLLRRGGASDATGMFPARPGGDPASFLRRTTR